MALVVNFTCTVCKKGRSEAIGAGRPTPTVCGGCQKLANDCARREHFHGLDGLTVEERLRKIERWIYDYKPPVSVMEVRC